MNKELRKRVAKLYDETARAHAAVMVELHTNGCTKRFLALCEAFDTLDTQLEHLGDETAAATKR